MVARFLICFFAIALPLGCSTPQQSKTLTVDIHGQSFKLELILDQSSRMKGMMHRTSIPPNSGMLFIFPDTQKRSFWMKNCRCPLDIISLSSRGQILKIATLEHGHNPPKSTTTPRDCCHVLELHGGVCMRHNIRRGDVVSFAR